jgi:5-(carboxyamino)imidazole ribonucleotide synthase
MERLDHVGVLTVEFFEVAPAAHGSDARLLANEFAPRVHNSGHWSIEGAATSQFENHIRAVTGAPLGDTTAKAPTVMVNIIGVAPDEAALRAVPHAHLHMYAKRPRPGRKLGHCTITGASPDAMRAALARVEALLAHAEDSGNR